MMAAAEVAAAIVVVMPTLIVMMVFVAIRIREDHRIEIRAAGPPRPAMPLPGTHDHGDHHQRHQANDPD